MIGTHLIELNVTHSTNAHASFLLENGNPPEGTVVLTNFQKTGRGQRESIWESEEGKNILCSIILYPQFLEIANQFILNQAVSLAVSETVEEFSGVRPHIKWPNDILVNERKIAGILIENNLRGQQFLSSIAGIGLNVNQLIFNNPSFAAVSIASLNGKPVNKNDVCKVLFEKLDYFYNLARKHESKLLNDQYMDLLFRLNEKAMFEILGKPTQAIIRGVKPEGDLIFEMQDGQIKYIRTKEVKYLF